MSGIPVVASFVSSIMRSTLSKAFRKSRNKIFTTLSALVSIYEVFVKEMSKNLLSTLVGGVTFGRGTTSADLTSRLVYVCVIYIFF